MQSVKTIFLNDEGSARIKLPKRDVLLSSLSASEHFRINMVCLGTTPWPTWTRSSRGAARDSPPFVPPKAGLDADVEAVEHEEEVEMFSRALEPPGEAEMSTCRDSQTLARLARSKTRSKASFPADEEEIDEDTEGKIVDEDVRVPMFKREGRETAPKEAALKVGVWFVPEFPNSRVQPVV